MSAKCGSTCRKSIMNPEIRAIAFDVDGTLYPQHSYYWRMFLSGVKAPLLSRAYNRARVAYRKEQGESQTVPENRAGYLDRLCRLMLAKPGREVSSSSSLARIRSRVERIFYGSWVRLYRHVPARKGMRETLLSFRERGYKLAVLSDFPLAGKLEALHVADLFDVALSSEDTGYLKPDARVFRLLSEKLGVKPCEVLFVGDSYQKDVIGSRGAGMHSCLITSSRRSRLYPMAEHVVTSFQELSAL